MKVTSKLIGGTVLGLACLAGTAQAALQLSGSTSGWFRDASSNITITNADDGSSASLHSGAPIPGSFQSALTFESTTFAGLQDGDTFGFGMLAYGNGRTHLGTSSGTALFDFYLDLNDPDLAPFKLTTISFGIDATPNEGGMVPDTFTASFAQPARRRIGDQLVTFTINDLLPATVVDEETWQPVGSVTVNFTPVPEPGTYGLVASAGLLGVAAYRRFRGRTASHALAS